jgi:hypothetical protein
MSDTPRTSAVIKNYESGRIGDGSFEAAYYYATEKMAEIEDELIALQESIRMNYVSLSDDDGIIEAFGVVAGWQGAKRKETRVSKPEADPSVSLGKDCYGEEIIPRANKLSIHTNRYCDKDGNVGGWIEGCALNIFWADNSSFDYVKATELVFKFNQPKTQ